MLVIPGSWEWNRAGISQSQEPALSLQQLLGKGHSQGGTWIQLQFLHGISNSPE